MIPVENKDELKRTNEIKTAAPMLDAIDIQGKTITADALLTQRDFANYLVDDRKADYHFTVKGNQPTLLDDVVRHFEHREQPDFVEPPVLTHGRIDIRRIWVTESLNKYVIFPHVGQVFAIERQSINKKTGEVSREIAYGITSKTRNQASAEQVLNVNRKHWGIESHHYIIDWNFDEDRSTIRTGYGPENCTRLRRFVIGIIQSKNIVNTVAQKMRQLNRNTRLVFDYLCMTENSQIANSNSAI
jgi:predicted transposase YbfD/YdcC